MRKLLFGLLILGGVIAAIAVMRRRSSSGVDEWDSFAPGDPYAQAPNATAKATDAVKDATAKATDAVKGATREEPPTPRRTPPPTREGYEGRRERTPPRQATEAAKDAATKANEAAKDA